MVGAGVLHNVQVNNKEKYVEKNPIIIYLCIFEILCLFRFSVMYVVNGFKVNYV